MTPHVIVTAAQVGQLLQTSRKARRLSQADLATKVGLSQSRVSRLELSPGELSLEQLMAWCSALGLELAVGPKGQAPGPTSSTDW
jgi:HTH-type transcriptional regulator / antitoxin HipB